MAMVKKPLLLLLHIFLLLFLCRGIGSFSANHDTFAVNDSIVEGDVRMTAPTVNPRGLSGHLPIEGAEAPLHTMQSAMLQSVHSNSGPVPCTLHYSTLPHYLAQRGLALNTSR